MQSQVTFATLGNIFIGPQDGTWTSLGAILQPVTKPVLPSLTKALSASSPEWFLAYPTVVLTIPIWYLTFLCMRTDFQLLAPASLPEGFWSLEPVLSVPMARGRSQVINVPHPLASFTWEQALTRTPSLLVLGWDNWGVSYTAPERFTGELLSSCPQWWWVWRHSFCWLPSLPSLALLSYWYVLD